MPPALSCGARAERLVVEVAWALSRYRRAAILRHAQVRALPSRKLGWTSRTYEARPGYPGGVTQREQVGPCPLLMEHRDRAPTWQKMQEGLYACKRARPQGTPQAS